MPDDRAGLRDRGDPARRRRRDRGHQRPRPRRRAARRRGRSQGAGGRARQADLRRQPPRRPRRRRPARARAAARAVPGDAGLRRALLAAAGRRRDRRRRAARRDHRRRRGRGLRQGRPAARAAVPREGRTSTGRRRPASSVYVDFPRGLSARKDLERHRFDFSFSGLKTSVARWVEARERSGEPVPVADVAASFQEAVCDVLVAQGARRGDLAGHRGHPDRRRRGRELPAPRHGHRARRGGRHPRPGAATRASAPTTARWWPPSAPSWSPAGRTPSELDLPADSSQPITTVVA